NRVVDEIRDRYGALPSSVLNLVEYGRIRVAADPLGVETIDSEGQAVVIRFRQNDRIDPLRLVKVVGEWPGATLVPPVSLKLSLDPALTASAGRRPETRPDASSGHRPGRRAPARAAGPAPRLARRGPVARRNVSAL